jgi:hypothetical protein
VFSSIANAAGQLRPTFFRVQTLVEKTENPPEEFAVAISENYVSRKKSDLVNSVSFAN